MPEQFIGYVLRNKKSGTMQASIFFNSNDIAEYNGSPFFVRMFLTRYKNNEKRNNAGQYFIDTSLNNYERNNRVLKANITIGTHNSFTGVNHLVLKAYVHKKVSVMIKEIIVINEGDIAVFHRTYPTIVEYKTSIKSNVSVRYQIKHDLNEEYSYEKFIYAKNFIELFYLK